MSSALDQLSNSSVSSDISLYRRILRAVVSACLVEMGFNSATEDVVETLAEMLNNFLLELGRSTKAVCEFTGRSEPLVTDVIIAIVEMGINLQSLISYAKRPSKVILPNLAANPPAAEPKRLQLGTQPSRPSYIPDYLPDFPDAHSYIRTLTHAAPATGYRNIRELASTHKREVARALTKFIAKTGDTENLFPDDPYAFPLIADKPKPMPYLDSALSSNSEEYDAMDEEADKWQDQQQRQQQQIQDDRDKADSHRLDRSDSYVSITGNSRLDVGGGGGLDGLEGDNLIDNPFLRPIKMPRMKSGSKKYKF